MDVFSIKEPRAMAGLSMAQLQSAIRQTGGESGACRIDGNENSRQTPSFPRDLQLAFRPETIDGALKAVRCGTSIALNKLLVSMVDHVFPDNVELKRGDDFSFLVWRHIFRAIIENERKAAESGKMIEVELELLQCVGDSREPIVRIAVVCEPGKPARPLSIHTP